MVGAAYFALLEFAPSYSVLVDDLPVIAAASLLAVIFAVTVAPKLFDRWRTPRLAVIANAVPLGAYLTYLGAGA